MGQEIDRTEFTQEDFDVFRERLVAETDLLKTWLKEGRFSEREGVGGFELEAWLIDPHYRPASINEAFIAKLGSPWVVPELARFNVELNAAPRVLRGDALSLMHRDLEQTWQSCQHVAEALDAHIIAIGILPTVRVQDLTLANMSRMRRYRALNEQVLRQRQGRPLALDIPGCEHLHVTHYDVMFESAATSCQIHLQVTPATAVRYYNASVVAAAPIVAAAANSPYLFGRDLWAETRLPLFEQSVAVGGPAGAAQGPVKRVTFGSGYLRRSIGECFGDNLEHYPVLLPIRYDEPPEQLHHLRLHNGTIWRWNRPLVDFDDDGRPHIRIEHRVVPGGPSVIDEIANMAFYFGLSRALAGCETPPETQLPFSRARDNLYTAARQGLDARVTWLDGEHWRVKALLLRELLPQAEAGLTELGIDAADRDRYLGVIEARVRQARTGADWQRAFVAAYGHNMVALTRAYLERQQDGAPVHEWDV